MKLPQFVCVKLKVGHPTGVRCTHPALGGPGGRIASVQVGLTQIFSHDRSTWVAPRFPSGYLDVEVDR